VAPQIGLDAVVVEQRVVDIDEKYGRIGADHMSGFLPSRSHSG